MRLPRDFTRRKSQRAGQAKTTGGLRFAASSWALAAFVSATPVAAHHSRAAFDVTTEVILHGTVAEVVWKNPHVYLTLEITQPDGASSMQEVEVGPLSTLRPIGLTEKVLPVGERVSIRANPSRRGPGHTVAGLDVTASDGQVYPLHVFGRGRMPASTAAASLAGRWVPVTDALGGLVQGARNWPLTDVGRAGVTDTVSQQMSQADCVPWAAPLLMALPMLRTIEVDDDAVTMRFDWMNAERTVHLNLAEHPADPEPSLQGHSIGRWEGGTLVIDSLGFAPDREGAGFGIPSGTSKRLTERLSLSLDRQRLTYEFTVIDPLSLLEPVSYAMEWIHRPDLEPTGDQCDPEIATRFLRE
jgi:hypothetical protein